jgi:hypothetical protein
MPYKDIQKKTLYQRNYMRIRRAAIRATNHNTTNSKLISGDVRPSTSTMLDPVEYDTDGNVLYDF